MARDPVEALLRLRHMTVDEARRDLASCLSAEENAAGAAREIEMAISRETVEACRMDADDGAVQAFADWLKRIRPAALAADAALEAASLHTAEARAVLVAARAAAEAAEGLLARRAAERQTVADRVEQLALDEAARGRESDAPPDRPVAVGERGRS